VGILGTVVVIAGASAWWFGLRKGSWFRRRREGKYQALQDPTQVGNGAMTAQSQSEIPLERMEPNPAPTSSDEVRELFATLRYRDSATF